MCKTMLLTYGFSCEGVFIINTELGVTDGYQGTKNTFSCYEKGLMYRETIRRKKLSGVVDGFLWWNIGQIGQWSSDADCLAEMLL